MKTQTYFFVFFLWLSISFSYGQTINYQASTQNLISEKNYLPDADWEKIFYDKSHSNSADQMGLNKQVAFAKDGSIFVSDGLKYTITKLSPTGKILKTFGRKGWNPGEFVNNQDLGGILDDRYLIVFDNQGRINFFDLEGKFVKLIKIDFGPTNIYPVKDGKMIIQGHVPYGTKAKKLLALLDYETEQYSQIYYTFKDYNDPSFGIKIPYKGIYYAFGSPFREEQFVRTTSEGKIILCSNDVEDVKVFSTTGDQYKQTDFDLQMNAIPVTEKVKDEFYQNLKNKLEKQGMDASFAEKVKEPGFFPDHVPFYYNVVVDDANNCLFFIYSDDNKDHQFKAYTTTGEYLGESEFKIEGYDPVNIPGSFTFRDGFVYVLALKKDAGNSLRILKCRVESR